MDYHLQLCRGGLQHNEVESDPPEKGSYLSYGPEFESFQLLLLRWVGGVEMWGVGAM